VNTAAADPAALVAKREELRQAIRAFLSFEVLAQRTLGDHWEVRTPEEQAQFVDLLRNLIETSYCRSLGTGDVDETQYSVDYTGERSRRGRTTVEATVRVDGGEHFLEVKLDTVDSGYIVYDLVTDDVSLEESYAESFENIIGEDGWAGLIERMEERLQEMQDEL
jgi:ABC-type transporter MlaC component